MALFRIFSVFGMRPQGFIYNSKGTATDTLRAAGNSPRSPAGAGYNYYNSLALQSQQKRRIDTMNTKFDRAAAKLKENADRLQIPAEDFKAGLDFAAQADNTRSTNSQSAAALSAS